ncbi:hypothetical protein LUZ61_013721 [Rhynchospora tenuis]|uniref:Glycosyltransferase n=1 Tax=Rhynchospora tenuis TaxID=198213 RepID=A0AAD5W9Q3_9POAL|nr:hypothetical protein LUZ61_013721 [Rhynchospora tenuis]
MNGLYHGSPTSPQPHFVLVPFLAQGHTIPIVDLAHVLVHHGAFVTFVTTPLNASRIRQYIEHARELQLPIRFVTLPINCSEVGLPEGSENLDTLTAGLKQFNAFLEACLQLRDPLISYLKEHGPPPNCVISDLCHPWTGDVARTFGIPRFSFVGFSAFSHLCRHIINSKNIYDKVTDDHQPVPLPGFPHPLEIPKTRSPLNFSISEGRVRYMIREEERKVQGVIVNTFEEMEPLYVECFEKAMEKKVWTLGPMGLYNRDTKKLNARGDKASIDIERCMNWLDGMQDQSVIFVSFGSLARIMPLQLIEIGLGLEASKKPFIWVIKFGPHNAEFEQWLIEERFEERTKDRGLLILGWAPQSAILSHNAIGGFMTHCGWNSVIESISSGVPMITWPHFAEQFLNEVLVVDILKIGVRIGVTSSVTWGSEKRDEVMVKRDDIESKVLELINEEGEGMKKRVKARELGNMAKKAMEESGSSYQNIKLLIQEIQQQIPVGEVEKANGLESLRCAQLN